MSGIIFQVKPCLIVRTAAEKYGCDYQETVFVNLNAYRQRPKYYTTILPGEEKLFTRKEAKAFSKDYKELNVIPMSRLGILLVPILFVPLTGNQRGVWLLCY